MAVGSSYIASTVADIPRAVLADVSGEVYAVNLAEEATKELFSSTSA